MENNNVIYGINGPVVTVKKADCFEMMEMVHVGKQKLVGEVIGITDEFTTIQVYEETTGLKPGDPVTGTGAPMNVLLGPGIIDNIFDGIERPLKAIEEQSGSFISRGASVSSLDDKKLWNVTLKVKVGDRLESGQIYATLPETPIIEHRLMVPPSISGVITKVMPNGEYKLFDTVAVIKDDDGEEHNLTLCQQWPIRTSRPVKERLTSSVPLITGQRVIDTLFPIAKGGTAPEEIIGYVRNLNLPKGGYELAFDVKGADGIQVPYEVRSMTDHKVVYCSGKSDSSHVVAPFELDAAAENCEIVFLLGDLGNVNLTFENVTLYKRS